jgi:hypothetical protein
MVYLQNYFNGSTLGATMNNFQIDMAFKNNKNDV